MFASVGKKLCAKILARAGLKGFALFAMYLLCSSFERFCHFIAKWYDNTLFSQTIYQRFKEYFSQDHSNRHAVLSLTFVRVDLSPK